MGLAKNEEEGRPSSADVEETLPLYSDLEAGDLATEPKAPEAKATPDEVRDFIVQIMQRRGTSLDHARRVAARWTLGTGRELRSYPPAMYRDVFGPEDGWVVYKEARTLYYKKEKKESMVRNKLSQAIAIVFSLSAVSVGASFYYCTDFDDEVSAWIVVAFPLIFFGFAGFVTSIIALTVKNDPEARAELELKSEWNKTPNNQQRSG